MKANGLKAKGSFRNLKMNTKRRKKTLLLGAPQMAIRAQKL